MMDNFLMSLGFTKSKAYSNLYYKVEEWILVILLLYLDDLFVTGVDGLIANTKRKLAVDFEMKDLGMMHSLQEISTQNGPFNFNSNSMSSCVSQ